MISHQGGSSPVQLVIATSIAMHYGHHIALGRSQNPQEARKKRDAQRKATDKVHPQTDGIESVTFWQSLNRLA